MEFVPTVLMTRQVCIVVEPLVVLIQTVHQELATQESVRVALT
jgi:hypothetical protein